MSRGFRIRIVVRLLLNLSGVFSTIQSEKFFSAEKEAVHKEPREREDNDEAPRRVPVGRGWKYRGRG